MANDRLDWTVCDFCGEPECDGAACGGAERAAMTAPAVRVTVRREGGPARVELYDEATPEWTPCLPGAVRAVRVEAGRAVLTFAGGERVEIGAPRGELSREGLREVLLETHRAVLQEALDALGKEGA